MSVRPPFTSRSPKRLAGLLLLAGVVPAWAGFQIAPANPSLRPGETCPFTLRTGSAGAPKVRWSLHTPDGKAADGSAGSIDALGRYRAPAAGVAPGRPQVRVRATLATDPGVHAETLVTLTGASPLWASLDKLMPARPAFTGMLVNDQPYPAPPAGTIPVVGTGLPLTLQWQAGADGKALRLAYEGPLGEGGAEVTGLTGARLQSPHPLLTFRLLSGGAPAPADADAWPLRQRGLVRLAFPPRPGTDPGMVPATPRDLACLEAGTVLATTARGHAVYAFNLGADAKAAWGENRELCGDPSKAGHVDGAMDQARFREPSFLAADPTADGAFLVADTGNHVLRRVAGNQVTTLAGVPGIAGWHDDAGPDRARFSSPRGLAVDGKGNVFVADAGNRVIRMVAADGAVTTVAGFPSSPGAKDGQGPLAQFTDLKGLALAGGALYAVDGHALRRVDLETRMVTTVCGQVGEAGFHAPRFGTRALKGPLPPCFNGPRGLCARDGLLYLADEGNQCVWTFNPATGDLSALAGDPGQNTFQEGMLRDGLPVPAFGMASLDGPTGAALAPQGRLILATGSSLAMATELDGGDLTFCAATVEGLPARIPAGQPCPLTFRLDPVSGPAALGPIEYEVLFFGAAATLDKVAAGHCLLGERVTVHGAFASPGQGIIVLQARTQQGVGVSARPLAVTVE